MDVGIYVPVSVIFPGVDSTPADLTSILRQLSRTDVLFWCARLNSVLTAHSDLSHEQKQAFGIRQFLSKEEIARLDRFCSAGRRSAGSVTIFFRGQSLELLRWAALCCDDQPSDGETFENPEVRRAFAQACLIASDMWSRRVYGDALSLSDGVSAARRRAVGPFRKAAEGNLTSGQLSQDLGRGWRLFREYMPRVDGGFESLFQSATDLSTEDYFICWSALLTNYLKPNSQATIFSEATSAPRTNCPELFRRFLALESQTPDELRAALWPRIAREDVSLAAAQLYDYRPLRERPILRTGDGRMIILDPVFASEKCAIGPLFHALPLANANRLFENFGIAFERYVCDLLERVFPPASGLVTPLSRNVTGRGASGEQFEVDACLNYVTDLMVIEIKAVWGRESTLSPENSDALLTLLRKRFSVTGGSVKGVGQLARIIGALRDRRWLGPHDEFSAARRVFPIIIVHDRLSGSPGFGNFLVEEFRKSLGCGVEAEPGVFDCGALRVFAPFVLTVEDVEMLEVSLEHTGLREILAEYNNRFPERMFPFSAFLAEISAAGRVFANRELAATSMHVLECAMHRLFGHPPVST